MDRQTDISIIVPVFNADTTIARCIESAINQSFDRFEIILVDDGSSDNSGVICDEYAERFPNITVLHIENQGVSTARNIGIEKANGYYIMFLDSDDYIDSDCLVNLTKKEADVSVGTIVWKYENGNIEKQINRKDELFFKDSYGTILPELLNERRLNYLHAKLFKKSIIIDNNIRFHDYKETYSEDTVFIFEFLKYSQSLFVSGEISYYYMPNGYGLGRRFLSDRYIKNCKLNQFIEDICKELCVYNDRMKEVVSIRRVQSAIWNIDGVIHNTSINNKNKKLILDTIQSDKILYEVVDKVEIDNKDDLERLLYKGSSNLLYYYSRKNHKQKVRGMVSKIIPKELKKIVRHE